MGPIIYGVRMRSGARWGVLLALGILALGGGFLLARETSTGETRVAVAAPVPSKPRLPIDPTKPPAEDIDYPRLQPGLAYQPETLGRSPFLWDYEAPKDWSVVTAPDEGLAQDEYRWRPADEPVSGGFSLRVKLVNAHETPATMVAAKRAVFDADAKDYPDFTVLSQTDDTLSFTWRVPSSNILRYNTFRWIAPPDDDEAQVEMSVAGRERDQAGLADMLDRVSASFTLR
jgi:hypothetical protein